MSIVAVYLYLVMQVKLEEGRIISLKIVTDNYFPGRGTYIT